MEICDWCGEHKKVRFIESMDSILMRMADYNNLFSIQKSGKHRCEECDAALKIKQEIDTQKAKKMKIKAQKVWRKKRDAILGQGDGGSK